MAHRTIYGRSVLNPKLRPGHGQYAPLPGAAAPPSAAAPTYIHTVHGSRYYGGAPVARRRRLRVAQ